MVAITELSVSSFTDVTHFVIRFCSISGNLDKVKCEILGHNGYIERLNVCHCSNILPVWSQWRCFGGAVALKATPPLQPQNAGRDSLQQAPQSTVARHGADRSHRKLQLSALSSHTRNRTVCLCVSAERRRSCCGERSRRWVTPSRVPSDPKNSKQQFHGNNCGKLPCESRGKPDEHSCWRGWRVRDRDCATELCECEEDCNPTGVSGRTC